jgi:hypothetical protein
MPDGLDDLLNDSTPGSGQSTGGQLRKQLEDALKEINGLKEQLSAQAATQRASALNGLFAKHAIPELARDFFPADADLTDEAATAFVAKYGQLWGATAAPAATPPAEQAATAAAQSFVSQAQQPALQPLTEEQYAAKFAEANTRDELMAMLAELNGAGA